MKTKIHLDMLRLDVSEKITDILEHQNQISRRRENNLAVFKAMGEDLSEKLNTICISQDLKETRQLSYEILERYKRVENVMLLLFQKNLEKQNISTQITKELILDFNKAATELSLTLMEKELVDKQNSILENMITSYVHISHDWKLFIKDILANLNKFFPLNSFHIVFKKDNDVVLESYLVSTDEKSSIEDEKELFDSFNNQILNILDIPNNISIKFDNTLLNSERTHSHLQKDTVIVRAVLTENFLKSTGILGVFYTKNLHLSEQERAVVKSTITVVTMMIGSGLALLNVLSEFQYYAIHDPLTGLFNRRYFNVNLESEISRCERYNRSFSLMMIDLDDFKEINDSFGHAVGDKALCIIADILHKHTRKTDICARIGGDEFAVILLESNIENNQDIAKLIVNSIKNQNLISKNGIDYRITASIGIVHYPTEAKNSDDLLAEVDNAMYEAKKSGKNNVCVAKDINNSNKIRHQILQKRTQDEILKEALKNGHIIPYYHSISDCKTLEVIAFEALARLQLPNEKIKTASEFIHIIEKYGLSHELDKSIIASAFKDKKACIDSNSCTSINTKVFINLSPQEIQNKNILNFAENLCQELNIPPNLIVFEILERDVIEDLKIMNNFLTQLRLKGFSFALDDFGSGYNSFHYLRELRFEFIKIDGEFIRNIHKSKVDCILVKNLSNLCREIGSKTIAEFVENKEILDKLREIGLDYVQGYYVSEPEPVMSI